MGRNAEALAAWDEAEGFFRQSGVPQGRGTVAARRGELHFREGREKEALYAWTEAETFFRQSGDPAARAVVLASRAELAREEGRLIEACRLLREVENIERGAGALHNAAITARMLRAWGCPEEG